MNRRDALQHVALLMGATLSAPTMAAILKAPMPPGASTSAFALSADQQTLLADIAETIIPTTSTPGAKAAGVGPFIEVMVKDCYSPEQQQSFLKGLGSVDEASQKAYSKSFVDLSNDQKTAILTQFETMAEEETKNSRNKAKDIDAETGQIKEEKKKKSDPLVPFFALTKELTLLGYFSSEIGATKALRYIAIPGRYEGCVKYEKGQKAWAT